MNTPNYSHAEIVIAAAGQPNLGKDEKRVPGYGAEITLFAGLDLPASVLHARGRTGLHVTAYRSCLEGIVKLVRLVRQRYGDIPVAITTNLSAVVAACSADYQPDADKEDADILRELAELCRCDAATAFNIRSNASEARLIIAKAIVDTVLRRCTPGPELELRSVSLWRPGEAA